MRWVIAGAPIERQRELLARFRAASPERARVGARGAARALRRALPRRQGPIALRQDPRAAPAAGRGRCPAAKNRAVAGLSTNSSTSPPSPRTSKAPALLVHGEHRGRLEAPAEVGDPRPVADAGEGSRGTEHEPMLRDGLRRAHARGHADRPIPCHRCAAPRSSPPSGPPRASRRRSADGRSGHGRRAAELLPRDARGARRDGPQRARRRRPGRAAGGDPAGPAGPEAAHRPAARGRRRAHAGRAPDVPLRRRRERRATPTT